MRVIGFGFDSIKAERKNPAKGKIEVSADIKIKSITQENLDSIVKDQIPLKFNFNFSINYKPSIAEISLQGHLIVLADKNKAKIILKKWKDKKLGEDVKLPLFNIILTKCNLRALQLEEEFNLPSHVPMPRISPKPQEKAGYTG